MMMLSLIMWLVCALPVAVLIGYCALGEEAGDLRSGDRGPANRDATQA